jgi:ribA/ribD-fused uncharacterized protein
MKTIEQIRTKDDLIALVASGDSVKYLCFWGHSKSASGAVTKSCLSQWFVAPFKLDNVIYATAEHYMMAEKARLFDNHELIKEIVQSSHPKKAKALGRKVTGFDNAVWNQHRVDIVVSANLAKFSQNQALADFLLKTDKRVLVEASPADKIWGIGLAGDDSDSTNPHKWKGLNLLGFALMEVRESLKRVYK